jgi:hypothetical protein
MSSQIESKFNELFLPIRNAINTAEMAYAEFCRRELMRVTDLIHHELRIFKFRPEVEVSNSGSVTVSLGGRNTLPGLKMGITSNVGFNWYYEAGDVTADQLKEIEALIKRELPVGFLNPAVQSGGNKTTRYFTVNLDGGQTSVNTSQE